MKNVTSLDTIAANFNLYRADNLPTTHQRGKYCSGKIERAERDTEHLKAAIQFIESQSDIESGLYFECREQTNSMTGAHELYYIDHSYYLVKLPNCDYVLILQGGGYRDKGKYHFYPYYGYINSVNNISYSQRQDALKGIQERNKIGTFTRKKLDSWGAYCQQYIDALNSLRDSHDTTQRKRIEEMEAIINSIKGAKVTRDKSGYTVWIEAPLFNVTLKLDKSTNYLSKDIRFNGGVDDVAKICELF